MNIEWLGFMAPIIVVCLQLAIMLWLHKITKVVQRLLKITKCIIPEVRTMRSQRLNMPTSLDRSREREADRVARVVEAHTSLTTQGTVTDKIN